MRKGGKWEPRELKFQQLYPLFSFKLLFLKCDPQKLHHDVRAGAAADLVSSILGSQTDERNCPQNTSVRLGITYIYYHLTTTRRHSSISIAYTRKYCETGTTYMYSNKSLLERNSCEHQRLTTKDSVSFLSRRFAVTSMISSFARSTSIIVRCKGPTTPTHLGART